MLERNKDVIRRLMRDVFNAGNLDLIDDLYDPKLAPAARRWIEPFLASFAEVEMEVKDLIAEDDRVVGRFVCSGTHAGEWRGHPATGRRFRRIDEVYIFRLKDGRIVQAWGIEDTLRRLEQLGLR